MCKSAAYISKLLEGYSLIRITYESKYFSADKDKDEEKKQEKAKKYRLMDKIILQIVESVLAASIPTLYLVKFDFKNKMGYQRFFLHPLSNPSLLYNGKLPKTHQEIFNEGATEDNRINGSYHEAEIEKGEDGEYVEINDSLSNSQPINGGKLSVKTKRNQRIISETSRKVPSYYFLENEMEQTITKNYSQNPNFCFGVEIVTIEEFMRRRIKKINKISDRDMIEFNGEILLSDGDLEYPPDDIKKFFKRIALLIDYNHWTTRTGKEDFTSNKYITFNEAKRYNDLFVSTFYGFPKDYHKLGEWMINRYLWNIKQSLLKGENLEHWTIDKHKVMVIVQYDKDRNKLEKRKFYKAKEYLEYKDDKGQERFINFKLIFHICVLYTITPYQMEFINSGKYEIRDDLLLRHRQGLEGEVRGLDLTYYDHVLNKLGVTKERVTTEFINHPYFTNDSYKREIIKEYTNEDLLTKRIPFHHVSEYK
jgi:hypothetical protein